jgi:heme/copper-type cytochrome/quinol oxidase subunit 3
MLNETLGKLHFFATFIGVYCLFLPMHVAGVAGNPRRYPDFTNFEFLAPLLTMHQFMTWAAFFTASAQVVFLINLFWSMLRGRHAPPNPWSADTLEWNGPSTTSDQATEGEATTVLGTTLAATTMLFAAFGSAYVVRRGISDDWVSLTLPGVLYASVLPCVAVSMAVEAARRSARRRQMFLVCGALFASIFVALHVYGWRQVGHLSTSPAAAFFFIIDGAFLLCVIGGAFLITRVQSHYWRYLNALWLLLLAFFYFWR